MCTRYTSVLVLLIAGVFASPAWPAQGDGQKMGPLARSERSSSAARRVSSCRQPIRPRPPGLRMQSLGPGAERVGHLSIINARVAEVPNTALAALANSPVVARISLDRPVRGSLERTGATVGATAVRQNLGLDGSGIAIAIIDSGITPSHDDLAGPGGPRVLAFVDYVNGRTLPYDDYGHGTHVAGIVSRERVRFRGREKRHRAGCESRRAESAGCVGRRHYQQRHCGPRLCRRQQGRAAHPHRQPLRLGRRLRVVQHGSAHARGAARGRCRSRGRRGGRQRRSRFRRGDAVWGQHCSGQRALGLDRRRFQSPRHGRTIRRHDGCVQFSWTRSGRLRCQTGRGRTRCGHRIAQRSGERVIYSQVLHICSPERRRPPISRISVSAARAWRRPWSPGRLR